MTLPKRLQERPYENRKLARVPMNCSVSSKEGATYQVINYNYKYVAVEPTAKSPCMHLEPVEGLEIVCIFERTVRNELDLYAVSNYYDIHNSVQKRMLLEKWLNENQLSYEEQKAISEKRIREEIKKNKIKEFSEMDYL